MNRASGDLRQRSWRRARPRRCRARQPAGEVLEERTLLSGAAHLSLHPLDHARNAKKGVSGYQQTNLVSNLASEHPRLVDPKLVNPWGMVSVAGIPGDFTIADSGSGVVTLYSVDPAGTVSELSNVVTFASDSPTG